ncbi:MAG: hypothetical protein U9R08_03610 [Nanoarchaeota archaeon]|nr:hypothetical protein [Nanoarchaeota archaeon]
MKGIMFFGKIFASKLPLLKVVFIPAIAWGIVIIGVLNTLSKKGFGEAMIELVQKSLASEYTINQNVTLAIQNPELFGFMHFLEIVSAVLIFYYLVKWITKAQIGDTGAQAWMGAARWSILIVIILEIAVISVTNLDLQFWNYFIPIKDSFWYLLMNFYHVVDATPILTFFASSPNVAEINQSINFTDSF